MNAESKINVHYSSLIGLKAELLRKQAEIEAVKAKQENAVPTNKPKTKIKKSSEKEKKRNLKENETVNEPEDITTMKTLKKSKLMLQAKSRLYEKLSKSHINMNPNFLVDFEHKQDDSYYSEEEYQRDDDHKSDYDSDSEWVEYTDCFGRTRKCLREDLPQMKEKDALLRKDIEKPKKDVNEPVLFVEDRQPEKEPEIEIMRRKWEEQTAKLAEKTDIHYQDILFDEARTHGVGYYAFSQDEEERAKQQENLSKLRKETEQKQKENQEVRDMKSKIQQNRLRVARMRQRIRAGLPADETEEELAANSTVSSYPDNDEKQEINSSKEDTNNQSSNETNNSVKTDVREAAKRKLEETESKIDAFGKMLGRSNQWYVMSQEEWVHKKRKERIDEFAPTYSNFQRGESFDLKNTTNKSSTDKNLKNSNDLSDDDDSDIIGPMPPSQNDSSIIGPTPPLLEETNSQSSTGSTADANVNIADQIEAGLKYLRQQFENKYT